MAAAGVIHKVTLEAQKGFKRAFVNKLCECDSQTTKKTQQMKSDLTVRVKYFENFSMS
jgi:hypothetical protein